jgi:hypothetical protein
LLSLCPTNAVLMQSIFVGKLTATAETESRE